MRPSSRFFRQFGECDNPYSSANLAAIVDVFSLQIDRLHTAGLNGEKTRMRTWKTEHTCISFELYCFRVKICFEGFFFGTMDDQFQEEKPGRRMMIAVDESEESMYALQWAVDFLLFRPADPSADGDRIIVVHAENPMALSGHVAFTPHVLDILEKSQKTRTERVLSRAKSICGERNVKMETKTVIGDPRYAICEAADKLRVDLLVVGSHGHGAIKRALIGSVSDYCMHHAKCPVLVVKGHSDH